jgi:hypothetical protein
MSAVNQICFIFRKAIEDESKIQRELQLNYVDVVNSGRFLNFQTPAVEIKPAEERIRTDRLSVSGMVLLLSQLQALAESARLPVPTLLSFFNRKHVAC